MILKRHLAKPFGPQIALCNTGAALLAHSVGEVTCKRCLSINDKEKQGTTP